MKNNETQQFRDWYDEKVLLHCGIDKDRTPIVDNFRYRTIQARTHTMFELLKDAGFTGEHQSKVVFETIFATIAGAMFLGEQHDEK